MALFLWEKSCSQSAIIFSSYSADNLWFPNSEEKMMCRQELSFNPAFDAMHMYNFLYCNKNGLVIAPSLISIISSIARC